MKKKRILIADFYPIKRLENYDCTTLSIVAIAKNRFLPSLNPYNYEIGTISIYFDYQAEKLAKIEKNLYSDIRNWKDFRSIFPVETRSKAFEFLEKNLGMKYEKHNENDTGSLLLQVARNLEDNRPVIVPCNPFHLPYSEHYQRRPGGLLGSYHSMVVFGISLDEGKLWIYDPTFDNYFGPISLDDFVKSIEDKEGIDNFEGNIYCTLKYKEKKFNDINRELLLGSLGYLTNHAPTLFKEKLLAFFDDFIRFFNNLPDENCRNFLLEFGFYACRELAFRRSHWLDFLDYYGNKTDMKDISDEYTAYQNCIDIIYGVSNTLYANSLKTRKKLDFERMKDRLSQALEEEEAIFSSLYKKLQHS